MTHSRYDNNDDPYSDDLGHEFTQIRRIVTAFVIGGLVSSLVTLFITPTSGRQIRQTIRRTVDDVHSRADQTKEFVGNAPQRAKDTVNDIADTAKRRASKLKEVGEKVVDEQVTSLRHGAEEAIDVLKSG